MHIALLDSVWPEEPFPPVEQALREPNGLLAMGGCLSPVRLLNAYRQGIFPWYNANEPILWWSPDPRLVLLPERLQVSRSLIKKRRQGRFEVTFDQAFAKVIAACADNPRRNEGTWITRDISRAYNELHRLGYAHSAESWADGVLVGGLYGVAIGRVFFGESMFHLMTDASKIAFASLVEHLQAWGYALIDCQVYTRHLTSFGAESINRNLFVDLLQRFCSETASPDAWRRV